ncbi:MAG: lipopolysaccharide assembly protein LapA domain-containing protein [Actinophytocola sp.]|uniref:lipopolysaccharide assembly protein LapA domain-containing protein n=1 Tax=Actinophytocola sp. TaxID=1872138 RepID=UPI003C735683
MSVPRASRQFNGQVPIRSAPTDTPVAAGPVLPPAQPAPAAPSPAQVPSTRTGAAWVALAAAALLAVLLIIFLAQNTGSTEISFLWMTTTTPLAVALLVAAVGSVLLTVILGTARITQLRRRIRKQQRD